MIKKLVAHPDIPRDIRLNLGHWCLKASVKLILNYYFLEHSRHAQDDLHDMPQVQGRGAHKKIVSGSEQTSRQRTHHCRTKGNALIFCYGKKLNS
jgi:hypothetical protein